MKVLQLMVKHQAIHLLTRMQQTKSLFKTIGLIQQILMQQQELHPDGKCNLEFVICSINKRNYKQNLKKGPGVVGPF